MIRRVYLDYPRGPRSQGSLKVEERGRGQSDALRDQPLLALERGEIPSLVRAEPPEGIQPCHTPENSDKFVSLRLCSVAVAAIGKGHVILIVPPRPVGKGTG